MQRASPYRAGHQRARTEHGRRRASDATIDVQLDIMLIIGTYRRRLGAATADHVPSHGPCRISLVMSGGVSQARLVRQELETRGFSHCELQRPTADHSRPGPEPVHAAVRVRHSAIINGTGLDHDGFIEREGDLARVPQAFAPVVEATKAAILRAFGPGRCTALICTGASPGALPCPWCPISTS